MKFKAYQHITKLNSPETEGILDGIVHVFPKIDGTNTSVYLNDDGDVEVSSRNRILSLTHDNAGALAYVLSNKKFKDYLNKYPNHRLFGEWLVPHTIRDYTDDAWRKLYIFDVVEVMPDGSEHYLSYDDYAFSLEEFDIDFIPRICSWINPTAEQIAELQNNCTFLMKEGSLGEGIVIKNYQFVNKFGRTTWAKIVRPIVKAAVKLYRPISGAEVESAIVDSFVTPEFVEKEFAKISIEHDGFNKSLIPKFLGIAWYTFINEEMFNILRKFKSPKIDFAVLHKLTVERIKQIKSEVF